MKDEGRTQRGLAVRWATIQPHDRTKHLIRATTGTKKALCNVQKARHKGHHVVGFHFDKMSRVGKSTETEGRSVVVGTVGVGGRKEECLGGVMQTFWNLMIVQHCGRTECR